MDTTLVIFTASKECPTGGGILYSNHQNMFREYPNIYFANIDTGVLGSEHENA